MGGANDHRVVRLLRALLAFPRVLKLYPQGHARVEAQVTELARFLDDVFGGKKVPLSFNVRGVRVELNDEPVTAAPEITSDLAYKLRRRRIRSLILLPGIERSELKLLAELLCLDARELGRLGGAHAFFARSPHPHLQVSTFRGDGDEDDLPPATAGSGGRGAPLPYRSSPPPCASTRIWKRWPPPEPSRNPTWTRRIAVSPSPALSGRPA